MAPMFFFCLSIPKGDLDTKKTTPDIHVCPESLGAMLEYYFMELGLLFSFLMFPEVLTTYGKHN